MSYWPAELNKRPEVIQRFTQLIQDQESQSLQPQFAQSYYWLGETYQKSGRDDYADQVWRRGAALFPNDPMLQKKLAAQP
jgi:TolA-binding protein